jgi:hypothetical protein
LGHELPGPSLVVESADRVVLEEELGKERDSEVDLSPPGDEMRPFWMRLSRCVEVWRWPAAPHAGATSAVEYAGAPRKAMAAR